MDARKFLAVGAVPAVMALGALGFTSHQSSTQPNTAAQTQTTAQQANVQQGNQNTPDKTQSAESKGPDTDNVQQGDQTSPDKPGQAEQKEASGPDKDSVQQGGGAQVQQGDQNAPDNQGSPAESGK